jgi:hypothetical protein
MRHEHQARTVGVRPQRAKAPGRGTLVRLVACAMLASTVPAVARGQAGAAVDCVGQPISDVQVQIKPPYYARNGKWWETPIGIVTSLHKNTRPDVVRRFLLLDTGQPCDEQRRAESERILRAQPFLADASIRTFDDGNGGVILVVQTTDELTPIFGANASGKAPYLTYLKAGDGNIGGTARSFSVEWGDGRFRDTFGAHLLDYQFMGKPWLFELYGLREDAGVSQWGVDVRHPFITDQQRIAWTVTASDDQRLFDFHTQDTTIAEVDIDRKFYDVGGIIRIGQPGRLSLFGLSFSSEEDIPGLPPQLEPGIDYGVLLQRFQRRKNARINALWGIRSIAFKTVDRFDALNAAQDMRVGFQLGTLLGRSLNVLGTTDDDILLAADIYMGTGSRRTFGTFQGAVEGRQNYDENRWDGIVGSAQGTLYQRLADDHTLIADIAWGGGWNNRIPLQLRLGQVQGGVRGYKDSPEAGAFRAVGRLEDRWYLGKIRDQADVGLSFFTDVGRVWAGDAPFGVTTSPKVGAGIGLLAALPPGSKRTYRLDFAYPLSRDRYGKWEFRLAVTNANRPRSQREPRDLRYSREEVTPQSVFSWP